MRIEHVQLAIRPRTVLECLDITFLFCSRHIVGLLLTACIGILPFAIFNWWIANIPEMNGYMAYLMLAMELPWATMFVTLYLGQTIFSQKLSVRRMFQDSWRAIPGLLTYQVIIRGLCLILVVLVPVVFLGMYYLNEIILLEKSPVSRTWNRRSAMNARIIGRIISLRMMDLMVMCGGTVALAMLLRAISSLWDDRFDTLQRIFAEGDAEQDFGFAADWQLQTAFWVVIVFLTVFRFVSYLDCRIRREGWDVELKLRAQADLHLEREAAI